MRYHQTAAVTAQASSAGLFLPSDRVTVSVTGKHREPAELSDRQAHGMQTYGGPALVPRIKRELLECLARDGFSCAAAAVAADHR